MIWRILAFWSVMTIAAFAYKHFGQDAAIAAVSACMVILVPASEIERQIVELIKVVKS